MENGKQKNVKGLSKAIYIIARICKVFTIIGLIGLLIAMIVVPIVGTNIKTEDNNTLVIFGEKINYVRDNNQITVSYKEDSETIKGKDEVYSLNKVIDFLEENDIVRVTICVEFMLLFVSASVVFMYLVFKKTDKLFTNINREDTPFTLENVDHIKKIACFLLCSIIAPVFASTISEIMLGTDFSLNISLTKIVLILVLLCLSLIFEYGYNLQKESKLKMYGANNE